MSSQSAHSCLADAHSLIADAMFVANGHDCHEILWVSFLTLTFDKNGDVLIIQLLPYGCKNLIYPQKLSTTMLM